MRMNDIFEDAIYQKGLELYNNGYVSDIRHKDNIYAVQIKGKEKYRPYILENNNRIKKMSCSCENGNCIHLAALYIKLKKEKHMFIDKTFQGYYGIEDYNAMIEILPQELNKIVDQSNYTNVKLTISLLGKYLMDYNNMIIPRDISNQIDYIFDEFYSKLLKDMVYASYYSLWLEDVLTHDWLPSLSRLLCRITNHLPIKDIKRIYFEYLDYHRNQELVDEMTHSLIKMKVKLSKKEYRTLLKHMDNHSIDVIYLQIQEYLSTNDIEHAKNLFFKHELNLKRKFDMRHIECMVYMDSDNPQQYQKYVMEFYRQKKS